MDRKAHRLCRRRFLRGAGAAGAAAAMVPTLIPGAALGRGGAVGANERIGIGFIGMGKFAHDFHMPVLTGFDDVTAVAVCDVDTTRREHARQYVEGRYGEDYGGCAAYVDFREVLDRDDIDAVVVATPEHWHAIPIILACQAGKDIYCEKALTHNIVEAERCIEAVRKHGRVLQTGSQQRSNVFGRFREGVEIVRSGRLGRIERVHVGVGGPSRWCDLGEEEMEPGLAWDLWLGPAPQRPYHSALSPRGMHEHWPAWRDFREYGGGWLTDMGAHHYDIAQWALDRDDSGPVEVIPPEDPQSERGARLIFDDGIEVIHGGPGGCLFEGTDGTLHLDRGVLESDPAKIAQEPLGEDDVQLFRSPGHHRNWLDCIRSRQRPICDVEIGARAATLCHLTNIAYWYRRRLQWDPAAWRVVDDAEANAWLDRTWRSPWELPAV